MGRPQCSICGAEGVALTHEATGSYCDKCLQEDELKKLRQFHHDFSSTPHGEAVQLAAGHKERAEVAEKALEVERMKLVACSEAARANTRKVPCKIAPEYESATLQDVRDAVQREISHRDRAAKLEMSLDAQSAEIKNLYAEREALRSDYEGACKTIADMHAAAVGEVTGPNRGVVEDVQDIRSQLLEMTKAAESSDHQANMLRDERDGAVWCWQGDGEDHLESLTCPVLIRPEALRPMASALVLLAWEATSLSEGQTAKALGLDRISTRQLRTEAIQAGVAIVDAAKE